MKHKAVNALPVISIPAIVLHIFSLFIVPPRSIGFIGIVLSVILLIGLNIFAWRLEARIMRRLSREAEYASWESRHENAAVIAEQNLEQERRINKVHHDIHNHISVALAMLNENDAKAAGEYLEKLSAQIKSGV